LNGAIGGIDDYPSNYGRSEASLFQKSLFEAGILIKVGSARERHLPKSPVGNEWADFCLQFSFQNSQTDG